MRLIVETSHGACSSLLLNGRFRATGTLRDVYTGEGQLSPGLLVAPDWRGVRLLEVTPQLWEANPLVSIASLVSAKAGPEGGRIVHIAGRVASVSDRDSCQVRDTTGEMEVPLTPGLALAAGNQVEILGCWYPAGPTGVLQSAVCRRIPNGSEETPPLFVLTTAEQVKEMKREEAARGYPVKMRGIVTCNRPEFHSVVLQDATRGVYVALLPVDDSPLPRLGDYWEVEGVTDPGDFAPLVRSHRASFVGAGRLPEPLYPTWDQLMNGSADTQFVEMQGVITEVHTNHVLFLTRGGKINLGLPSTPAETVKRYENAVVRLRGCLFADWDPATHQVKVGHILVYDAAINVDQLAPADPFAAPLKSVAELRLFDPHANTFQRTKVSGQIVFRTPTEHCLLDRGNGLRFTTPADVELAIGDLVEVAGFADLDGPSPVLRDAAVRRVGAAPLPEPRPIPADDLLKEGYDSTLVRVEALLVGVRHESAEWVMEMQAGLRTFLARLGNSPQWPGTIPVGSRLELVGVYLAHSPNSPGQSASAFDLMLNDAGGLKVLVRPSWWTVRRVLALLSGMTAVLLVVGLWVVTLKRRVTAQTEIIRRQVAREATLDERTRLAREFHDTLEQALAGLAIQLNALAGALRGAPQQALKILSLARSMVRHSQEEARRSVRNLRALHLEERDLPTALSEMAAQARNGWQGKLQVRVTGTPQKLPLWVENHLLRICQEGTQNAIRHANPAEIRLELDFTPTALRVAVVDDGSGFDAQQATASAAGHFGLLGMRERSEKIGGQLSIRSEPGSGTRVEVTLPLSRAAAGAQSNDE
jgi:signal transduction histidine kinase